MNINPNYQQPQIQAQQPNLQAQQILLQQLQQGQSSNNSQFNQQQAADAAPAGFPDSAAAAAAAAAFYQRPLPATQSNQPNNQQLQANYFPQFSQQNQQSIQQQSNQTPTAKYAQPTNQSIQYPQNQSLIVPPHPQQKFFGQQQQQQQLQQPKITTINIENPNSQYWQHQLQLCQLSRSSNIPHFYARQYAQNSRKNKVGTYNEIKSLTLLDATKQIVAALEEQEKKNSEITTPTSSSAVLYGKKSVIQHPEEEHAQEERRMIAKTNGKQLWCQLDLTGQGLVNLSPKLFQYDFLESLYLSNNKLTSIPSVVGKLKGLRVLDLSHNRINEVPRELGICHNLRFLYLFDNNIKTLPSEFGNLGELLFLGIEGNPLDLKFANILAEHGTRQLICHLRDLKPVQYTPNPRPWLLLEDDGEIIDPITNQNAYTEDRLNNDTKNTFTLLSYNILCHHYATSKLFSYTPKWALEWDYRRSVLQEEILNQDRDIVCMQEVENRSFSEFWVPLLAKYGYKGVYYCKTRSKTMSEADSKKVDGCATFYKTSKFNLISKQNFEYNSVCMGSDKYKKTKDLFNRFMNKDNIALITFLEHIETGEKIVIANTHLHWDPTFNDVKTLQVGILLEELQGIMKRLHRTGSIDEVRSNSLIICGDFNSIKDSAVYQLFSTGSVLKHADLDGRDYGKFTEEGFRHNFKLKSAYDSIDDLPFTNFSPSFTDVIDYIWYSTSTLQVKGVLGKVDEDYSSHYIGFPSAHFPSDHVPVVTKFQIKKSGGSTKKPDFKPDFKTGSSRKT